MGRTEADLSLRGGVLGEPGSQVRSATVASVDQVRCWEHKRTALFSPALTPHAGSSSAMNRYPNEPNICLAMRQS